MAKNSNDAFSDLSLEGMSKYSERNAEAQRLKRAAELDDRIREFAARKKDARWISEADDFCSREELANKDVFDLSKEAYRLPLILEEARGLAKHAEEDKLAQIEAESRAKRARMEAEAREKALRDKLSREERERAYQSEADAFDKRISKLSKAQRGAHWCDEVERADADAKKLSTDVKLLVKGIAALDKMLAESKKMRADAKAAAKKRADDEAREQAERDAALARIENDKRVAKAKADAEAARIKAEREAEAERERAAKEAAEAKAKAERDAALAKIESEKKIAQAKADAEAARIRAAKEAEEQEAARRRLEEENKQRLAKMEADAKEKALRERLGKEEADRRNRESAENMDALVAKLSGAPRTKLWIKEIKKAYAEAENMPTDAKLMVAGLDDLEEMHAEAVAREMAGALDKEINDLYHGTESAEWAERVVALHGRLDGRTGVREEACVAAKAYMKNYGLIAEMLPKTGPLIEEFKRGVANAKAKKEAEKRRAAAKEQRKRVAAKIGSGILSGVKVLGLTALIVALIGIGVALSMVFPEQIGWTVPATVAAVLLALDLIFKWDLKVDITVAAVALVAGIVFILVPADLALASVGVVMGAYLFISGIINAFGVDAAVFGKGKRIRKKASFEMQKLLFIGMAAAGGVLASVALGLFIGGLVWITLGVGLGVTVLAITVVSDKGSRELHTLWPTILAAAIPIGTVALMFFDREYVFVGMMVAAGYFLGGLIKLIIGLYKGKSFGEIFVMSRYVEGFGPTVVSTAILVLSVLVFFTYVGVADFIISDDGVLEKSYNADVTVVIPEGVTEIATGAFDSTIQFTYNKNIRRLVIPEGVRVINADAFPNTFAVEEIYLPSTLERIEGETMLLQTTYSTVKVYYAGSEESARSFENKIIPIANGEWFEDLFSGVYNQCSSVEWEYNFDYITEFYAD